MKFQERKSNLYNFGAKRKLKEHQIKALTLSKDEPDYALLMEQGTGKTKVVLENAQYLYSIGKIKTLIIVAWPNGVHRNWVENEIPEDVAIEHKAEYWSSSLTKTKEKSLISLHAYEGFKIITFNIEAMTSEKAQTWLLRFVRLGDCMFVIDQSACIKTPSAKRTRFLMKVSYMPQIKYKRILDGAPSAEGAEELFSQFKFLNPAIIGLNSYTAFKAEYCKMGYFPGQIVGYKNLDELYSKISKFSFRALAADCLDLPDRIYKRWNFDLTSKERRIYDELRSLNLTFFKPEDPEAGLLSENLALTKNMRLQQIASGWFNNDGEIEAIDDKPARLLALIDLLKEAKGKALIFARFRADLELLQNYFGAEAVSFHGGVSDDDRSANKKKFMEEPKVKYFLGQPKSAGIGHTLTAANHIIYYSNDHSLRLREESEKRAHRQGLKHTLLIWDLIAADTADSKIVKCLQDKKKISEEILKDPVSFFMEVK